MCSGDFGTCVALSLGVALIPQGDCLVIAKGFGFKRILIGAGVLAVSLAAFERPADAARITFTVAAQTTSDSVPEPASIVLFGAGLLVLARYSRKRETA